ncbi:MAG: multicopper oxidase family protein [Methylobacteriaceae bacterium]|nr:multicopper oxidase family protein [Methylobacteriaceae bacterium]
MRLDRRALLAGALAGAGAAALGARARTHGGGALPGRPARGATGQVVERRLVAAERDAAVLGPGRPTTRVWTYADAGEPGFPLIRARVGDRLDVTLENRLPEHTALHWHGVRVPNGQDGVPFLTQAPVQPGESFRYSFELPDPGTFFVHPHCNESGQSGRGLAAVLVVDGDEPPDLRPDLDLVLAVKDWRLAPDGAFLPLDTKEGAGKAGTFGTVRGVNGRAGPAASLVPTGGDLRLRLLNLDPTRVLELGIEEGDAIVLAVDGQAVRPFPLDSWRLGPAMRLDLLVRAPSRAGDALRVVDYGAAEPWTVATLTAEGPDVGRGPFEAKTLYAARVPRPEVATAERLSFAFGSGSGSSTPSAATGGLPPDDPLARALLDSLCTRDTSLWAINETSWPTGPNAALPPPLATLEAGRSYLFELVNTTAHAHPIHLHGHSFEVLSSTRQPGLPRHLADTVLLLPRDRVEIAFVAAPGDWMLHCHVLEHLEYGMMGYLRVA